MKAGKLLAVLIKAGWTLEHQRGSHRVLVKPGMTQLVFAFHDGVEVGPSMVAKIAKFAGLRREDL